MHHGFGYPCCFGCLAGFGLAQTTTDHVCCMMKTVDQSQWSQSGGCTLAGCNTAMAAVSVSSEDTIYVLGFKLFLSLGRFTIPKTQRPATCCATRARDSCRFTMYTSRRPAALRNYGNYTEMWREENRLQLKGSVFLLDNCGF